MTSNAAPVDYTNSLTPDEASTIKAAIAAWPFAWFRSRIVWDTNGPGDAGRYNYVVIDPMAGPAFGNGFLVGKDEGRYSISFQWRDGEDPDEWAPVDSLGEALQLVRDFVLGTVESWGLKAA